MEPRLRGEQLQLKDRESVPLVGREEELRFLQNGLVPSGDNVIGIIGIPQIGKTALTKEFLNRCKEQGLSTTYIDLADKKYNGEEGRTLLANKLHQDILPESFPVVIGLDSIDRADSNTFLWSQEEIINPLMNENARADKHTLLVIASRHKPNMMSRDLIFPLERRYVELSLDPLTDASTEQQVRAMGVDKFGIRGNELTSYTERIPGLNDAAVRWMVERGIEHPTQELFDHLVKDVLLDGLADRDPKTAINLLGVAVTPVFDSRLLAHISLELDSRANQTSINVRQLREMLGNLQQTGLVEPTSEGYGYNVPSTARRVLDNYVQTTRPDVYGRIHEIAAAHFASEADQAVRSALPESVQEQLNRGFLYHTQIISSLKTNSSS